LVQYKERERKKWKEWRKQNPKLPDMQIIVFWKVGFFFHSLHFAPVPSKKLVNKN